MAGELALEQRATVADEGEVTAVAFPDEIHGKRLPKTDKGCGRDEDMWYLIFAERPTNGYFPRHRFRDQAKEVFFNFTDRYEI